MNCKNLQNRFAKISFIVMFFQNTGERLSMCLCEPTPLCNEEEDTDLFQSEAPVFPISFRKGEDLIPSLMGKYVCVLESMCVSG